MAWLDLDSIAEEFAELSGGHGAKSLLDAGLSFRRRSGGKKSDRPKKTKVAASVAARIAGACSHCGLPLPPPRPTGPIARLHSECRNPARWIAIREQAMPVMSALRTARRAAGVCPVHPARPCEPGKKVCGECRAQNNDRAARNRAERRRLDPAAFAAEAREREAARRRRAGGGSVRALRCGACGVEGHNRRSCAAR